MSFNVIAAVMQSLSPEVVTKIAASLGIDRALALKAVSAMVPAILGTFARKAASPDGARHLVTVISAQDPGLLGQLGTVLGGPQEGAYIDYGSKLLRDAVGGPAAEGLVGALGRYAGLDTKHSQNLFAVVAPVAAGTLANYDAANALGAEGLAKILGTQADAFDKALPAGLLSHLGGELKPTAATPAP